MVKPLPPPPTPPSMTKFHGYQHIYRKYTNWDSRKHRVGGREVPPFRPSPPPRLAHLWVYFVCIFNIQDIITNSSLRSECCSHARCTHHRDARRLVLAALGSFQWRQDNTQGFNSQRSRGEFFRRVQEPLYLKTKRFSRWVFPKFTRKKINERLTPLVIIDVRIIIWFTWINCCVRLLHHISWVPTYSP